MVLRALHLCAGYGGFELALRGLARTVCNCERDSYAAACLVARMEEKRLDQAPIWDEIETFDGTNWHGKVDIVTAGLPCQPFSQAGQRRGLDDPRHLWPHCHRIIADVGPEYVFLENVPDVVVAGWLGGVLGDLADLGFDAEWGLYSAQEAGAPQERQRFWLVAHRDRHGYEEVGDLSGEQRHADRRGSAPVADTASVDEREPDDQGRPEPRDDPRAHAGGNGEPVADAAGFGRDEGFGPATWGRSAVLEDHRYPPFPWDRAGWERWIDTGGPEPGLRRGADGAPPWLADALHLGGNGLVPACARAAWDALCERAGWTYEPDTKEDPDAHQPVPR